MQRVSPDAWAMVAIAAAVLLTHLIYLLDFSDPNPLGPGSALATSLVGGVTNGLAAIDPNNGYVSQAIGHFGALQVLGLHAPWWNPYEGTGAPLLGETQSAVLFPATWLTAISNGQLYEHMLLEGTAGISTYLLLRRLSVNRWVATGGGIAFALNGTFAWYAHATVNPIACLPLLLLGVEHAYSAAAEGRHGGWWLMAVAGALSVYAGFPEVAYINTLVALPWLGWRAAGLRAPGTRTQFALKVGLAALAGALLAAPMLVAMVNALQHGELGTHSSTVLGADRLGSNALPPLLLPYVYGPVFGYPGAHGQLTALWSVLAGYLSTSLLVLALIGAVGREKRGLRIALLAWGAIVFARIYGEPPLLDHVIGVFPGMSRVGFFRYGGSALALIVIILAALGANDALHELRRRRSLLAGAVAGAIVVAAAVGARPMVSQLGAKFAHRPYYWGSVAWGLLMVLAVVAATQIRRVDRRGVALAALMAVDAALLFAAPTASSPRAVSIDLAPVAYLRQHLGNSRFFTLGPLQPDYGSYFQLAELNVNDVPVPRRFSHYITARLDGGVDPTLFVGTYALNRSWFVPSPEQELLRNLPGYREAGVRYVLSPAGQPLPQSPSGLTLVFRTPTVLIYRLAGAQSYYSATRPGCRVAAEGREKAVVSCPGGATLVRRETYFPGWTAAIDGHAAPIHPHDGLFQAVTLPPGRHVVSFAFEPPDMGWALVGFLVGAGMVLGSGARRRSRRRREPPTAAWSPPEPVSAPR